MISVPGHEFAKAGTWYGLADHLGRIWIISSLCHNVSALHVIQNHVLVRVVLAFLNAELEASALSDKVVIRQ